MNHHALTLGHLIALALILICSGCGTVRTLDAVNDGAPLIFGGTRLNLTAIDNPAAAERRHHTVPPRLPSLDLPLSATLDVLLLPYTTASVMSRAVMGERRR